MLQPHLWIPSRPDNLNRPSGFRANVQSCPDSLIVPPDHRVKCESRRLKCLLLHFCQVSYGQHLEALSFRLRLRPFILRLWWHDTKGPRLTCENMGMYKMMWHGGQYLLGAVASGRGVVIPLPSPCGSVVGHRT